MCQDFKMEKKITQNWIQGNYIYISSCSLNLLYTHIIAFSLFIILLLSIKDLKLKI